MLRAISESRDLYNVLETGLRAVVSQLPMFDAFVACQSGRDWTVMSPRDSAKSMPVDLISEALDRGQVAFSDVDFVSPMTSELKSPVALVLTAAPTSDRKIEYQSRKIADVMVSLSEVFSAAIRACRKVAQLHRRCEQFEQMLRIGAQWSREEDVDHLLEAIAETAASLLGAERASIFLWDRPRRKLVGRPALGVAGNALEVDDSSGVVGAVLQSGQARRWHSGDDQESEVNRTVDRRLKFETRSLIAVPMWNTGRTPRHSDDPSKSAGKALDSEARAGRSLIGVFEVINRIDGQFTTDDELALAELATQAAAAIQNTQLRQKLIANRDQLVDSAAQSAQVVGQHASIEAVRTTAIRVAETDLSVLILGENGTGKEVLARNIHFNSPRRHQPFIAVNCAALVETLLESELFGHEKGAFTDAQQTRKGKFEVADGGTIFLDEIGDLSAGGQAKLLRVLEERKVVRVGGSIAIPVDVRVIAATNQPLLEMVREKKFREDLFFRLNIVTLNLPPLRQRGKDIVTLAEHFLDQFSQQIGRKAPRFSDAAKQVLTEHSWPGNIRELRNLVERICYLCPSEFIGTDDLSLNTGSLLAEPSTSSGDAGRWAKQSLSDATKSFQVEHIERAINACQGNITDAAARLGMQRSNLYRKMRQLGMDTGDEQFA